MRRRRRRRRRRRATGLHAGFLLSTILDGSAARVPQAARRRDALRGLRIYQEHLGPGHVLRQ